jgi:hypothetical protein
MPQGHGNICVVSISVLKRQAFQIVGILPRKHMRMLIAVLCSKRQFQTRIWPQKSGLFRVSAAPKSSTPLGLNAPGNSMEKFVEHRLFRSSMHPRKMFLGMCIVYDHLHP